MNAAAATATATPVVHIDNVVAGYLPGVNILNGCSLVAEQGELIGIIGPNGAGKSTLLKAIFGQVNIRSGAVRLEGEDITGLKANKLVARGVGMVPQTNNVFPSLTIEENLQMGLFQKPKAYAERLEFVTGIFAELGKRLIVGEAYVEWNVVMATALLAMLPPALVVVLMQKWFVKGLIDTEK